MSNEGLVWKISLFVILEIGDSLDIPWHSSAFAIYLYPLPFPLPLPLQLSHSLHITSSLQMNFGVHGHASNFTLSVFDRYWKQDMTLEEGKEVLKKCLQALNERYVM